MSHNRRQFLVGAAALSLVSALGPRGFAAREKQTRIILLGTKGGPGVGKSGRSNPSTLLLINDIPYVVDCGYGVSRQLISAGVSLNRVRYIFITHHHSDPNLEYGPFFFNAWVTGRPIPVYAYGPTGLQKLPPLFFEYQKFQFVNPTIANLHPLLRRPLP